MPWFYESLFAVSTKLLYLPLIFRKLLPTELHHSILINWKLVFMISFVFVSVDRTTLKPLISFNPCLLKLFSLRSFYCSDYWLLDFCIFFLLCYCYFFIDQDHVRTVNWFLHLYLKASPVFNSWYLRLIYFDLFIILLIGMNYIKIVVYFPPRFFTGYRSLSRSNDTKQVWP